MVSRLIHVFKAVDIPWCGVDSSKYTSLLTLASLVCPSLHEHCPIRHCVCAHILPHIIIHLQQQPISGPVASTSQPPTISAPPTSNAPPRPVFPAYQQQPPLGDPNTAGGGAAAATTMAPTLPEVNRRPAEKVPSVGPGCKLMHPEDDLSLVSIYICTS